MESFIDEQLKEKAKKEGISLYSDRFEEQQPLCIFGTSGVCCKNCHAGPCRIIPRKSERGICGANVDTIIMRNLVRITAAGCSCHTDHAREIALALLDVADGKTDSYKIKDENKLRQLAKKLGKKNTGSIKQVAKLVALEALEDFRRQQGLFQKQEHKYLNWIDLHATKERISQWKKINVLPVNADLESSHALHQTTMGTDAHPNSLLHSCIRLGITDGYAGLHLATDMQDIIFGTPAITKSESDLGTIKEDYVNIAVHGHVPLLADKIVEWSGKLNKEAREVGAKGVNVIGVCCSGNEVLMRHGIPLASHILQSELVIVTGAIEAVVVDTQCIYPSLQDVASCYHTKLITTMLAKIPGAMNIEFNTQNADRAAKQIVMEAINNFPKRNKNKILIPNKKTKLYGGYSVEAIVNYLEKIDAKKPLRPLVNAIINKDILGIVAVVGCRNPKLRGQKFTEEMIRMLLKNNVLVVTTGCIAHSAAQDGLMLPDAKQFCGSSLRKFLETAEQKTHIGIPPVLHMGSCVDNSRIGDLLTAVSDYTKIPIHGLPVAASAPEYMTEKAMSIGFFALSLGVTTHFNPMPPITGSENAKKMLSVDLNNLVNSKMIFGDTPEKAASAIIDVLKEKRKKLGI